MEQLQIDWSASPARELDRVSSRIGAAILSFCRSHRTFHADDLRVYVAMETGTAAPASADRILRDLRKRGLVSYRVLSRQSSLYAVDSVAA